MIPDALWMFSTVAGPSACKTHIKQQCFNKMVCKSNVSPRLYHFLRSNPVSALAELTACLMAVITPMPRSMEGSPVALEPRILAGFLPVS